MPPSTGDRFAEPRPDADSVGEPLALAAGEQQATESSPGDGRGFVADDQEALAVDALDLEPVGAPGPSGTACGGLSRQRLPTRARRHASVAVDLLRKAHPTCGSAPFSSVVRAAQRSPSVPGRRSRLSIRGGRTRRRAPPGRPTYRRGRRAPAGAPGDPSDLAGRGRQPRRRGSPCPQRGRRPPPRWRGNVRPVVAAPRDDPDAAGLDMDVEPVAVPLDLVRPMRGDRRLERTRRQARAPPGPAWDRGRAAFGGKARSRDRARRRRRGSPAAWYAAVSEVLSPSRHDDGAGLRSRQRHSGTILAVVSAQGFIPAGGSIQRVAAARLGAVPKVG